MARWTALTVALLAVSFSGPMASCPASAEVPEPATFWTGPMHSETPATLAGANVLRLETGISLAADPTIGFRLASPAKGELGVVTRDSDATVFEQTFDLDRQGS